MTKYKKPPYIYGLRETAECDDGSSVLPQDFLFNEYILITD